VCHGHWDVTERHTRPRREREKENERKAPTVSPSMVSKGKTREAEKGARERERGIEKREREREIEKRERETHTSATVNGIHGIDTQGREGRE